MSTFVSPEDVQSMEYFYEPFWQHKKPPVARQLHPSASFEDQIRISNLALYLIDFFTLCWLLGLKIQFYRSLSHLGTVGNLQWLVNSILWRQYWNLKSGFISNLCFLLCDDLRMFRCSFYVSWPFGHSLIPPVARQLHPLEAALESQMWYYLWSIFLTKCKL